MVELSSKMLQMYMMAIHEGHVLQQGFRNSKHTNFPCQFRRPLPGDINLVFSA